MELKKELAGRSIYRGLFSGKLENVEKDFLPQRTRRNTEEFFVFIVSTAENMRLEIKAYRRPKKASVALCVLCGKGLW